MQHEEWKYYSERLISYAFFVGRIEGLVDMCDRGFIAREEMIKGTREALAELQTKLTAKEDASVTTE